MVFSLILYLSILSVAIKPLRTTLSTLLKENFYLITRDK